MYMISNFSNESDVEQKFVFPFLTHASGLGFSNQEVATKAAIRKLPVDKGKPKSNYFPDYILQIDAVPLVVIEAKGPGIPLDGAIREASWMSGYLTRLFILKMF